jgi:hypothetical protein
VPSAQTKERVMSRVPAVEFGPPPFAAMAATDASDSLHSMEW